ncbi:T9SS type A sorting domain-containing protein [Paracrocinitomix mangrovi]|uniref:T9SS type A sorting domain-containing protein n=1 Tax=Paracrocinitomix mangrovi TaxID=2862509 RepID=UPI001C8D1E2E|nr:T9SS type A sorting domain-containing protein [Paracrocinitomix mangrovi]UKN00390.1 T9SS type A sorting domain-containing protein [Paracrocinitomix mangrovi]
MKKTFVLVLMTCSAIYSKAQTMWAEHAAEVFYNHCTECHNPNGIGPMSLMSYADAVTYAPLIESYVDAGIMPPWTADTGYQHFSQERVLSAQEKQIILDWIQDGTQMGDLGQAPPQPVYSSDQVLPGVPDLVVTAPNYMSKATSSDDDYVCFVIPSNLLQNRKVKAFEVIPGNRQIVHHCLVYSDDTGWPATDTSGNCAGPVSSTLMGGYTPGSSPIIFPSTANFSAGMELTAGTDIVLAMHYPAGSYGEFDQTKVNFYFYDEPVNNYRPVSCEPIIQNWSFSIPANSFDTITVASGAIPNDYTMLSVFPHMHLLGHYIESWGVTSGNDTLNFVRIPQWDFDWQDFYWFEHMQHIPAGTNIFGKGIWNNTVTNPHNPNSPPITVGAGLNTSDEMFLIYYHYMDYWAGDENINIDSLTTEFLNFGGENPHHSDVIVYPNPFDQSTTITYHLNSASFVSVYIYDMQGRIINKLIREQQVSGTHSINWDGNDGEGKEVGSGMYVYSMMIDGKSYTGKILKR